MICVNGGLMENFFKNLNESLSEAFNCEVEILDLSHNKVLQELSMLYELSLQEFDKYVSKETIFTIQCNIKYIACIIHNKPYFIKFIGIKTDDKTLYGKVKLLIDLIEKNTALKDNDNIKETESKAFFLNKILNYQDEEELNSIKLWNIELGYNLELPRITCVMSFKNSSIEKHKEYIKGLIFNKLINHKFITTEDIISFINADQLIICKAIDTNSLENFRKNFTDFFKYLDTYSLQNYRRNLSCGIGLCHPGFENIKTSFEEATFALEFKKQPGLAFLEDYLLEYVLSKIPFHIFEHFFKDKYNQIKDRAELIDSINALVNSNMNIGQAASSIFIHKNTLMLRIKNIKSILKLDPFHKENDRVTLLLLQHYMNIAKE